MTHFCNEPTKFLAKKNFDPLSLPPPCQDGNSFDKVGFHHQEDMRRVAMAALSAFHGQQEIKDKYLARVKAHREADHLIRGTGWESGRGCAVGCTLESYNHSRYPIELGIPEWLAWLEDTLFERMPEQNSQLWPEQFLSAIRPGADLETVKGPFLIFILESALEKFDHEKFLDCKKAIDGVIALWRLPKNERTGAAAEAAAAAAAAAAAEAAEAAGWAARAAEYEKFANKLLELLAAA